MSTLFTELDVPTSTVFFKVSNTDLIYNSYQQLEQAEFKDLLYQAMISFNDNATEEMDLILFHDMFKHAETLSRILVSIYIIRN